MCWKRVCITCCSDSLCTSHQEALFATSMFTDQPLQGKALIDIPHQVIFQLMEGLISTGLVLVKGFLQTCYFPCGLKLDVKISVLSVKPWPGPSNSLMKHSKRKIPHSSIVQLDNPMVFKQIPDAEGNPGIQYSDTMSCMWLHFKQ